MLVPLPALSSPSLLQLPPCLPFPSHQANKSLSAPHASLPPALTHTCVTLSTRRAVSSAASPPQHATRWHAHPPHCCRPSLWTPGEPERPASGSRASCSSSLPPQSFLSLSVHQNCTQNLSVSMPAALLRSSMLIALAPLPLPPLLAANAGCSIIAWNSCVPRSALVSGMWPLAASKL